MFMESRTRSPHSRDDITAVERDEGPKEEHQNDGALCLYKLDIILGPHWGTIYNIEIDIYIYIIKKRGEERRIDKRFGKRKEITLAIH